MIRILVTVPLSPVVIDALSAIPEFAISIKTGLSSGELLDEIREADALVSGGSPFISAEILSAGAGLKLILCGDPPGQVDEAAALRRHVEIRAIPTGTTGQDGKNSGPAEDTKTIAILKDFFNV
jgi:phosphoglycerate dehydrogenase-like enzyme